MHTRKKIVVIGGGYVGLTVAVLLAQNNEVKIIDTDPQKVELINQRKAPIHDELLEREFLRNKLDLIAVLQGEEFYRQSDFIIISVPTSFDDIKDEMNMTCVESTIKNILKVNSTAKIIIKSTIPINYTSSIRKKFKTNNIFYSPEFLRESTGLYDNFYPSRIIVSADETKTNRFIAYEFAKMLKEGAKKENPEILILGLSEAEAVKLFSNAYLALRIAFFNELDTYAEVKKLKTKEIINGICLDERIGDYYNNPSFGYGGYCLPKDTKQLLKCYEKIPSILVEAIVCSNHERKVFITNQILKLITQYNKRQRDKECVLGIYRFNMKDKSDNLRESAILDVINELQKEKIKILIYEPLLNSQIKYLKNEIVNDLKKFKSMSSIIIANRYSDEIADVWYKVYTRDIYYRD